MYIPYYIYKQKTKIKLIINGQTYESGEVAVNQRLAIWKHDEGFQNIKLKTNYNGSNSYLLEFQFWKNGSNVGRAKCSIPFGRNRKDCLDIADRNFHIVGKFLYTAIWLTQTQPFYQNPNPYLNSNAQYPQKSLSKPTQPPVPNFSNQTPPKKVQPQFQLQPQSQPQPQLLSQSQIVYRPPDLSKPFFPQPHPNAYLNSNSNAKGYGYDSEIMTKSTTNPKKQKNKKQDDSIFTSWLFSGGCFGKRKLKKSKPYYVIEPILVDQAQLQYAPQDERQPFPIQYYTKRFGEKYSV